MDDWDANNLRPANHLVGADFKSAHGLTRLRCNFPPPRLHRHENSPCHPNPVLPLYYRRTGETRYPSWCALETLVKPPLPAGEGWGEGESTFAVHP